MLRATRAHAPAPAPAPAHAHTRPRPRPRPRTRTRTRARARARTPLRGRTRAHARGPTPVITYLFEKTWNIARHDVNDRPSYPPSRITAIGFTKYYTTTPASFSMINVHHAATRKLMLRFATRGCFSRRCKNMHTLFRTAYHAAQLALYVVGWRHVQAVARVPR